MAKTAAERQREKRKRDIMTRENVTDVTPRKVHVFPESGMAFDKDRLKINFTPGEPSVTIDGRDPWDTGAST